MDIKMEDIDQAEYIKLFESIKNGIKLLEANNPDNENIDELKLILADNVSKDGNIHNRSSLMNKNFHLFYLNYKDCMHKYKTGHLYN
jgi:hypothetical protein